MWIVQVVSFPGNTLKVLGTKKLIWARLGLTLANFLMMTMLRAVVVVLRVILQRIILPSIREKGDDFFVKLLQVHCRY